MQLIQYLTKDVRNRIILKKILPAAFLFNNTFNFLLLLLLLSRSKIYVQDTYTKLACVRCVCDRSFEIDVQRFVELFQYN